MFELANKHINIINGYVDSSKSEPLISYLVAHSLVIAYADLEQEIKRAVTDRCKNNEDSFGNKFLVKAVNRRVQSIKFSDLSGLLNDFDKSYKTKFGKMFPENGRTRTYYNNIITNRHSIAHGYSFNATWMDVNEWWPEACRIVRTFRDILETDSK